ncbi:hypothetical protein KY285_017530 [Solanum tuberosum]|nr:hypothetical protein KY285_017530 [Solanum tuberosum]
MQRKFSRMDQHWDWKQVCHIAENYKVTISSLMVCWNKPSDDTWKLNTDGSFMKAQNKVGIDKIVRNKNGDLAMAFAYQTHFYTNNFSEAYAVLIGVSWCCDKNIRNIEMKLDSMIVISMIKGGDQTLLEATEYNR